MALIRSEHELDLAKELLDDIELSRLEPEQLILKSARLARLCGSEEFQQWLRYEMRGYYSDVELSLSYMQKTGRWTDREKKEGYWSPLSQIVSSCEAQQLKLKSMSTPNVGGTDFAIKVMNDYYSVIAAISSNISKLSGIRSRVLGILHGFVSDIYYKKELGKVRISGEILLG